MSKIKIVFQYPNGEKKEIEAAIGDSVLQVAHSNGIPIEGACEGSLACSTCHVIVDEKTYSQCCMAKKSDDEEDLLDLAFGCTNTSRLGCQVILTADMDGMILQIPSGTRNLG
jgi:2Fe-2S ferredoxin